MNVDRALVESPIGTLELEIAPTGLRRLEFRSAWDGKRSRRTRRGDASGSIVSRVEAYFDGDLAALDGIPVDPEGTPFQQRVWRELRKVRAGRIVSYGELARRIGRPAAVRAVGLCNARNPVGIVVPCHRVIGADGSLTGYGGGLDRKRWLLEHEGVLLSAD